MDCNDGGYCALMPAGLLSKTCMGIERFPKKMFILKIEVKLKLKNLKAASWI